jgi:predicted ferric reductase
MKKIIFYSIPATAVIVWILEGILLGHFQTISIQSSLAKLTGLLGIAFLTLNFVTSARYDFIERWFGGLDIVYKYHKLAGKLAYVFIFLHPFFLLTRRAINIDSIKTLYIPGVTPSATLNTGIVAFYILNFLLLLTLVLKLPYQFWKRTHRFMIFVLFFAGLHVFVAGNELSKPYGVALMVIGIYSFVYRELIYGFFVKKKYYEVVDIKKFGSVSDIFLKPLGNKLNFKPGQYVFMRFLNSPTIPNEAHPYSMSSDNSDEIIRISAKELGNYSETLDTAKVGDKVKLVGPHGLFTVDNKHKKQLWISGGIGTTPFLSMINDVNKDIDLAFIHSNRTEEETIYTEEIQKKLNPQSKLLKHISDAEGFITAEYFKSNIPDVAERVVYICGPTVMMYAMRDILLDLGVPRKHIRFEDFNFK